MNTQTILPNKTAIEGAVTAARKQRTLYSYGAVFFVGLALALLGNDACWQAFGLGLWFPGAGFLAAGGWWILLCPVFLVLFVVALIAWLGSGMLIAPILIWLGGAALAGLAAGTVIWTPSIIIATAVLIVGSGFINNKLKGQQKAQLALRDERNAYLPQAIQDVSERATPAQTGSERELTASQLAGLRYSIDRGLQPLEDWSNFTKIDQFQPAAYRYQLNNLGYTLAMAQCHYTPNFHGYMSRAQRNIIEKYTRKENWQYWRLERLWGSFSTDFDPAKDDNIMLTGFYGINLGQYQINTGDDRYAQDGALEFKLNDKTVYKHDFHSISASISRNMKKADFCLFPCEPNWIYTPCNFRGLTSILMHDRLYKSDEAEQLTPTFLQHLEDEFTLPDGNLLTAMSQHLGHAIPFPFTNDPRAHMMNAFAPEEAKKAWAMARNDMTRYKDGELQIILEGKGVDFGDYSTGHVATLASIASAAGEMGDTEVQQAALAKLEADYPPEMKDGVAWYPAANGTRAWITMAQINQTDDWRNSVNQGPGEFALTGPLLDEVNYPAILVAKAVSTQGNDLSLVLHGDNSEQPLSFARLTANGHYTLNTPEGAHDVVADNEGKATTTVQLNGRVELTLTPKGE